MAPEPAREVPPAWYRVCQVSNRVQAGVVAEAFGSTTTACRSDPDSTGVDEVRG
jgi:hypothetical protein